MIGGIDLHLMFRFTAGPAGKRRKSTMKYRIVNLDPHLHIFEPYLGRPMEGKDYELIEQRCISSDEILDLARDAHVIFAIGAQMTADIIGQLTQCIIIGRPGIGTDNVDHHAATEHGIVVTYLPDFCVEEVADHAIAQVLALYKKLVFLDRLVRRGKWGLEYVFPLKRIRGSVLGLVAFGNIARNVADRAKVFGMEIIAYDPFVAPTIFAEHGVRPVELDELLRTSDYVSLHIPLLPDTKHFINRERLDLMKPSAYLINTARGGVVDEAALIEVLSEKRIAGAALDCMDPEPIDPDNPMLKMDHVMITPHMAACSDESMDDYRRRACEHIADVLNGIRPQYVRNPEVLEKVKLK
jgi:D-3-phosphoglycerate dehydrogenase